MGIKNFGTGTPKFNEGIIVSGSSPQLYVSGNIGIDQYVYHNGDGDTFINFTDDKIILKAGGKAMVTLEEKGSAPHEITLNDGGNNIDFVVKGNGSGAGNPGMKFDASTNKLGINGVGTPSYELTVAGDIGLDEYIYHNGDDDTYIQFGDDQMILHAGGRSMLKLEEAVSAQDKLIVNHGALDIDFQVKSENHANLIRTDAANDRLGIGTSGPNRILDVFDYANPQLRLSHTTGSKYVDFQASAAGDLILTGSSANATYIFTSAGNSKINVQSNAGDGDAEIGFSVDAGASLAFSLGVDDGDSDKFKIGTATVSTNTRLTIDGNGNVGIGTADPKSPLDVHVSAGYIAALPDDSGGGHVAAWGTEDTTDTLAAGKLMYMATDGKWKYADADAVATSGGVLLGIALGSAVSDGILLKGYFDAATLQGSFTKGAACYVSETVGVIDFTAPSATGDVVRVVGYGTDTANVIYFDPSDTWIEL